MEDEGWLIECLTDGIYESSRRRRVRSEIQKTPTSFLTLKGAIGYLKHWRRLSDGYGNDLESELDEDTTSDDESNFEKTDSS
jgi:hypothetical protein